MTNHLDCAGVERRLWEYLDGALPAEEAARVREHLDRCGGCGPEYRCCQAFLALLHRCGTSCGGAPEALRERLERRLADGP